MGVDPGHAPDVPEDALTGNEDAQLALWMTYELHYRGFDDVSPDAEWDLGILALRRQLERRFEEQLRAVTASAEVPWTPMWARCCWTWRNQRTGPASRYGCNAMQQSIRCAITSVSAASCS